MRSLLAMVAILQWWCPCLGAASTACEDPKLHALLLSIYGCDTLEVPVALAKVKGAEPGGALAGMFISGGMCHGLTFGIS